MRQHLVSTSPIEWACDAYRGYWGYSVRPDGIDWPEGMGYPAFTHEQMVECARINDVLGSKYGFDSFAHVEYDSDADAWYEAFGDGHERLIAGDHDIDVDDVYVLEPFVVDGVKLYALGGISGWAWWPYCDEDGFGCEVV